MCWDVDLHLTFGPQKQSFAAKRILRRSNFAGRKRIRKLYEQSSSSWILRGRRGLLRVLIQVRFRTGDVGVQRKEITASEKNAS